MKNLNQDNQSQVTEACCCNECNCSECNCTCETKQGGELKQCSCTTQNNCCG